MDKQLFHYKGIKQHLFIVGILTVCQAATILLQAIQLAIAISNMFNGTAPTAVLPNLLSFAAAYFLRSFIQWIKDRISFQFAEKTALQSQDQLIKKLFKLGPRGIGKFGSGNMVTLVLEGIPHFRTYLELFIPRTISMVCIPIVVLIYILNLDTISAIVLILTMPILIAFLILLGLVAQKYAKTQWGSYQLLARHFVDSLRGLLTLKYLGKSKSHQYAIENVSNKYRIATNRSLRIAFLSSFSLDFFTSLSVAVVAVELGIRLINGNLELQEALTILILAPEYFQPIRDLGNDYHATMDGKDAGEKIHQILAKQTRALNDSVKSITRWNRNSSFIVHSLNKRSTEGSVIINDIQFNVEGSKKIGIIGASGAGKSTLIDLLTGFSEASSGYISIDGKTIDMSNPEWQKQLIYIPQNPYIFSGTVTENISFYAPNSTESEIKYAIKHSGLTKLIESLPNGLNEIIGQGGRTLSGGEEQRIALARALLQNRPIMFFDEPTAHLDIETEFEIKQLILPIIKDKLVFFATHRLHWMHEMDSIIVLKDGDLVEMGTHDELYSAKGEYYRLVSAKDFNIREEIIE